MSEPTAQRIYDVEFLSMSVHNRRAVYMVKLRELEEIQDERHGERFFAQVWEHYITLPITEDGLDLFDAEEYLRTGKDSSRKIEALQKWAKERWELDHGLYF